VSSSIQTFFQKHFVSFFEALDVPFFLKPEERFCLFLKKMIVFFGVPVVFSPVSVIKNLGLDILLSTWPVREV
jgi:hypothetical protein